MLISRPGWGEGLRRPVRGENADALIPTGFTRGYTPPLLRSEDESNSLDVMLFCPRQNAPRSFGVDSDVSAGKRFLLAAGFERR